MRNRLFILLLLGALWVLPSCRHTIVYSDFMPIDSNKWHIDSVAHFDYAIEDTSSAYQMLLYIRHTELYPYQNMWLFVNDGFTCDTIEFYLADDRGQWLGNKHHGFIEMPVLWEEAKQFPDTGVYHISVQQGMRDTLLRGVTDVGIEIVKKSER